MGHPPRTLRNTDMGAPCLAFETWALACSHATGLVRYQQAEDLHFVTFSCFHRLPHLGAAPARNAFERSLETMRRRYDFLVMGYVVMPEHVHLLVSEPRLAVLAKALQALKLSVAVQHAERPFWQKRYYDFNVFSEEKRVEKLRYIHRNPVTRGLVSSPEAWAWSSFKQWKTGEVRVVEWRLPGRPRRGREVGPTSQTRDVGHPAPGGSARDK